MINENYNYNLNYNQIMLFMNELCKIKNDSINLKDETLEKFNKYVNKRTNEINKLKSKIPSFLYPFINTNYEISKDIMEYLVMLTGKNPFDTENISEYNKELKKVK